MVLQAASRAEHKFWVKNLVKLCANALYKGSTITGIIDVVYMQTEMCNARFVAEEYSRLRGGPNRDNKDSLENLKKSTTRSDREELGPPPSHNRQARAPTTLTRSNSREDHRLESYSRGAGGPTSSSRLSDHIAGSSRPSRVSLMP